MTTFKDRMGYIWKNAKAVVTARPGSTLSVGCMIGGVALMGVYKGVHGTLEDYHLAQEQISRIELELDGLSDSTSMLDYPMDSKVLEEPFRLVSESADTVYPKEAAYVLEGLADLMALYDSDVPVNHAYWRTVDVEHRLKPLVMKDDLWLVSGVIALLAGGVAAAFCFALEDEYIDWTSFDDYMREKYPAPPPQPTPEEPEITIPADEDPWEIEVPEMPAEQHEDPWLNDILADNGEDE